MSQYHKNVSTELIYTSDRNPTTANNKFIKISKNQMKAVMAVKYGIANAVPTPVHRGREVPTSPLGNRTPLVAGWRMSDARVSFLEMRGGRGCAMSLSFIFNLYPSFLAFAKNFKLLCSSDLCSSGLGMGSGSADCGSGAEEEAQE
jgi:hypothetical protein